MFNDVQEYMRKSQVERQTHLDLKQGCVEIGGSDSTYYKGLLAHFLKTTIPSHANKEAHLKVYLCHACNNHKCSNPVHLYWGTSKENFADYMATPESKSMHENCILKYGEEKLKEMRKISGRKGGLAGGGHNKGKLEIDLEMWKIALDQVDCMKRGWQTKVARNLGTTHTTVRRIVKNHFPNLSAKYQKRKSN